MEARFERTSRGSDSFPFEYYHLDKTHPRYVMPYHWHMDYEIVRVISGRLPLFVGNSRLDLSDGDSIMVPPGAIHGSMPPAGTYECAVFDISKLFLEGSFNLKAMRTFWDVRGETPVVIKSGSEKSGSIEDFFCAIRSDERPIDHKMLLATGSLLSVFGYYFDEVTHAPSSHKEKSERIKKVIIYIRENYASHISLDDLAMAAGLSREYLSREFKAAIGMSPINFLIEYRIERSKKILLSPTGSVTDAALSVGFSDISYYIKKFTAINGCTPLQFKKSIGKYNVK